MTTTLEMTTDIVIQWEQLSPPLWKARGCLYAILTPDNSELLYLGIAWDSTVRERWNCRAKDGLWDAMERLGYDTHRLIVGHFHLRPEIRLSKKLAFDVESLLIHRLRPPGNDKCIQSRISRPGLRVVCDGYWPLKRIRFNDER